MQHKDDVLDGELCLGAGWCLPRPPFQLHPTIAVHGVPGDGTRRVPILVEESREGFIIAVVVRSKDVLRTRAALAPATH